MPKVPGVNHLVAVRAFEKLGYQIVRQSGHIVMRKDQSVLTVPRNNPIKPHTMGALVKVAGLSVKEFQELCK